MFILSIPWPGKMERLVNNITWAIQLWEKRLTEVEMAYHVFFLSLKFSKYQQRCGSHKLGGFVKKICDFFSMISSPSVLSDLVFKAGAFISLLTSITAALYCTLVRQGRIWEWISLNRYSFLLMIWTLLNEFKSSCSNWEGIDLYSCSVAPLADVNCIDRLNLWNYLSPRPVFDWNNHQNWFVPVHRAS